MKIDHRRLHLVRETKNQLHRCSESTVLYALHWLHVTTGIYLVSSPITQGPTDLPSTYQPFHQARNLPSTPDSYYTYLSINYQSYVWYQTSIVYTEIYVRDTKQAPLAQPPYLTLWLSKKE